MASRCDANGLTETWTRCYERDECGDADGCLCEQGVCAPRVCDPFTGTCDQGAARLCNALGTGYARTETCAEQCEAGACVTASCTGDEPPRCEEELLLVCSAGAWTVQNCALFVDPPGPDEPHYCGAVDAGDPACWPRVCEPLTARCDDGAVVTCNGDGSAETIEPCAEGFRCSSGACVADLSKPSTPLPEPCTAAEQAAQIAQMIVSPMIPNTSVGGVPIWDADHGPTIAPMLIGRPEDGLFCSPTRVFTNSYVWGDNYDLFVFFDEDTGRLEGTMAYGGYSGSLAGTYETEDGSAHPVSVRLWEPLSVDGEDLTHYPDWTTTASLSAVDKMLQETFAGSAPLADTYDCTFYGFCSVSYLDDPGTPATPQSTLLVFDSMGVSLEVHEDGSVGMVMIDPPRVPRALSVAIIDFDLDGDGTVDGGIDAGGCPISLTAGPTLADLSPCLRPGELAHLFYGPLVGSTGLFTSGPVAFWASRPSIESAPMEIGSAPAATDRIVRFQAELGLRTPVPELVPAQLGADYAARLEALVRTSVADSPGHPLESFAITVPPDLPTEPQPLGILPDATGADWGETARQAVLQAYDGLTSIEQEAVTVDFERSGVLAAPLARAVLARVTHGASETAPFVSQGDVAEAPYGEGQRYYHQGADPVAGAHFRVAGQPMRVYATVSTAGEIVILDVSAGLESFDEVMQDLGAALANAEGADVFDGAYFELRVSQTYTPEWVAAAGAAFGGTDSYSVGGIGVRVLPATPDELDGRLAVELLWPQSVRDGVPEWLGVTVPGQRAERGGRYSRLVAPATWETVPADRVELRGAETQLSLGIDLDGHIGFVKAGWFKGPVHLCDGPEISPGVLDHLQFRHGERIAPKLADWRARVDPSFEEACEIWTEGDPEGPWFTLTSIANHVRIAGSDRVVSATLWR